MLCGRSQYSHTDLFPWSLCNSVGLHTDCSSSRKRTKGRGSWQLERDTSLRRQEFSWFSRCWVNVSHTLEGSVGSPWLCIPKMSMVALQGREICTLGCGNGTQRVREGTGGEVKESFGWRCWGVRGRKESLGLQRDVRGSSFRGGGEDLQESRLLRLSCSRT